MEIRDPNSAFVIIQHFDPRALSAEVLNAEWKSEIPIQRSSCVIQHFDPCSAEC